MLSKGFWVLFLGQCVIALGGLSIVLWWIDWHARDLLQGKSLRFQKQLAPWSRSSRKINVEPIILPHPKRQFSPILRDFWPSLRARLARPKSPIYIFFMANTLVSKMSFAGARHCHTSLGQVMLEFVLVWQP